MTSEIEYTCNNCGHEGINTRAVPDVPELVRYRIWFDNNYNEIVDEDHDGEYVRYSEAAAVIAAEQQKTKDAEELAFRMDRFAKTYLKHMRNAEQRAEAAEAELAQIKAQVPIVTLHVTRLGTDIKYKKNCLPVGDHNLYAAPVDQTAEIERLKLDLQGHIEGTKKLTDEKIDAEFKAIDLGKEIERKDELLTAAVDDYNTVLGCNEQLRGALRFYADKSNWESGGFEHALSDDGGHNVLTLIMSDIDKDRGEIARTALSGKEQS